MTESVFTLRRLLWVAVLVLAGGAATAAGRADEDRDESLTVSRPTFRPATPEEVAVTLLAPGAPGHASALTHATSCSVTTFRTTVVEFHWAAPADGITALRVDYTIFRDGFERGRFATTGRISPIARAVGVEGIEPGLRPYWRVLSETATGWVTSDIGRFDVPTCPWDEPPAWAE